MRSVAGFAAIVLSAIAVAGCGGSQPDASSDDAPSEDARSVLENLESLGKGDIVISASSSRAFGPFTFGPGGYVLRFKRGGSDGRLSVTLESKPNSRMQPFQHVLDTTEASGSRSVNVSGKLYVRVVSTASSYELRFTPRR